MYGYDFVEEERPRAQRQETSGSSGLSDPPGVLLVTGALPVPAAVKPEAGGLRPALLAEA